MAAVATGSIQCPLGQTAREAAAGTGRCLAGGQNDSVLRPQGRTQNQIACVPWKLRAFVLKGGEGRTWEHQTFLGRVRWGELWLIHLCNPG